VKTGMRRLRLKAEHVSVGHVIGNGNQAFNQAAAVIELEILAAGELRHRLRHITLQAVGSGDGGHFGERQRRSEQAQAVECLHRLVLGCIRIGVLAHASMRRAGVSVLERDPARIATRMNRKLPVGIVRRVRLTAGESDTINSGVGVADDT
jgi:hypothetical protein